MTTVLYQARLHVHCSDDDPELASLYVDARQFSPTLEAAKAEVEREARDLQAELGGVLGEWSGDGPWEFGYNAEGDEDYGEFDDYRWVWRVSRVELPW